MVTFGRGSARFILVVRQSGPVHFVLFPGCSIVFHVESLASKSLRPVWCRASTCLLKGYILNVVFASPTTNSDCHVGIEWNPANT